MSFRIMEEDTQDAHECLCSDVLTTKHVPLPGVPAAALSEAPKRSLLFTPFQNLTWTSVCCFQSEPELL